MSYQATFNAIDGLVDSLVSTPESIGTGYDNVDYTPVEGALRMQVTNLPIEDYVASVGAPGNNVVRLEGQTSIQIFSPFNTGIDAAWTLAEKIKTAFLAKTLSGIKFRQVDPVNVGNDGSEHQVNVSLIWHTEEIGG